MVLQRGKPLRIWGESDSFQTLEVLLNGKAVASGISVCGKFSFFLPPQEAAENAQLQISGASDSITLKNVDIGEVWIAGGQSNMEFPLIYDQDAATVIPEANDGHLRFFDAAKHTFEGEEEEGFKDSKNFGKWFGFKPEHAGCFSAEGAFFAIRLRRELNVPVGIVGCNYGGTSASAWLSEQCLQADPDLRVYLDEYNAALNKLDLAKYKKMGKKARKIIASKTQQRATDNMMKGTPNIFDTILALPGLPSLVSYMMSLGPESQNRPSGLYHCMVEKIAGFTAQGVIWHQGETDEAKAELYGKLFTALIKCWRAAWEDELPFLFVQLAPFGKWLASKGDNFPIVRQQQEAVSKSMAKSYMASIMDAGMEKDIHPKNKRVVGERLALLALGKIYGRDILCFPPEALSAVQREGFVEVAFANAGAGLRIDGDTVNDLELFDASEKPIKWSKADVSGNVLRVFAQSQAHEIRFAWKGYAKANIYSSADLCAKPFKLICG